MSRPSVSKSARSSKCSSSTDLASTFLEIMCSRSSRSSTSVHPPYAELRTALQKAKGEDKCIDYSSVFVHQDEAIRSIAHSLLPQSTPQKLPSEQEMQSLAQRAIIRLKRAYIGLEIQKNVRELERCSSTSSLCRGRATTQGAQKAQTPLQAPLSSTRECHLH